MFPQATDYVSKFTLTAFVDPGSNGCPITQYEAVSDTSGSSFAPPIYTTSLTDLTFSFPN